jgi:hypothetical protein
LLLTLALLSPEPLALEGPRAAQTTLEEPAPELAKRKRKKRKRRRRKKKKKKVEAPPPPPPKPKLAFVPLRVDGMQKNDLDRLNASLRTQVETTSGELMLPETETAGLLESAQAMGLGCDVNETPCAVKLGKILAMPSVVLGRASGEGARVGVELRLIDVEGGAVKRRVRGLIQADPDTGDYPTGPLVTELFALASASKQIVVSLAPEDADLVVDGIPTAGAGKLRTIDGLAPGPHVLLVTAEGFLPAKQDLDVGDDLLTVEIALSPVPDIVVEREISGFERALPWTVAGTGGALLVGGTVAAVVGAVPWFNHGGEVSDLNELDSESSDFNGLARQSNGQLDEHATAWQDYGATTVVTGLVAASIGAVALTGGTLWGVWLGDREAGEILDEEAQ